MTLVRRKLEAVSAAPAVEVFRALARFALARLVFFALAEWLMWGQRLAAAKSYCSIARRRAIFASAKSIHLLNVVTGTIAGARRYIGIRQRAGSPLPRPLR
jgi:hypothetical protein